MADILHDRTRKQLVKALTVLRWRAFAEDPLLFMRECVWVEAKPKMARLRGRPGHNRVPLELFGYQQEALGTIRDNQFTVVLKARQLGLTTIVMAYALWLLLFRPGTSIVLVSKDQDTADSALLMLDVMWQFMPEDVRAQAPQLVNDAARHHAWKFGDGSMSRIRSYAATETVAAGGTPDLVIWDEAALARAQGDTLRTLMPLTDAGGSMIVFSTARGGSNGFASLYKEAKRGLSMFVPVFYPWHHSRLMNRLADRVASCPAGPCDDCVDRTEYEAKRQTMSREPWKFHGEYPEDDEEAFRMSGHSRFSGLPGEDEFDEFPLRGSFVEDADGNPTFLQSPEGNLHIVQELLDGVPEGATAVLAVDPSEGGGGDFLAMTAGWMDEDGVPCRMAFWHSNDFEPADVATEANLLGRFLVGSDDRPALLAVEKAGGYGDTILHELRTVHRYPHLYVHTYTGHRKNRRDTTFGFPMNPTRRPLVIDALAKWLRFDTGVPTMIGVDPLLRAELGSFVVREDGKVAADVGAYDDLVMSTAIWVYVLQERGKSATSAMPEPKGEDDGKVLLSVAHLFAEAEEIRQKQDVRDARQMRRLMRRVR